MGIVQGPLCLNGKGNRQVPVPGDYLHSGRIHTSGIAFAASVFTLSTRPSLRTSCCFSKWASTDPTSPQLPSPCAISLDIMGMAWAVQAPQQTRTRSIHTASAKPASTLSTSKPGSVQADNGERPRNAMDIVRPPGIQELVINSPPKSGFALLTGFSIQNSSRLCHLPAFCRHGTLPCSLGAIQQSRTVWREKHHCKAPQDSQGSQHQESSCHPLPRGSHQAGGCREVPPAPWRGTSEGNTAPGWAAAPVHRDSPGPQPTSTAKPTQPAEPPTEQPQGRKTGEKSASPIAGSGGEQERPTLSTPTHRVATAPGWLGTALSVW